MSNEKLKMNHVSDDAKQTSLQTKDGVKHHRIDFKMAQNVLLIWLDNNIDENNDACHNIITQLRHTINAISTFTDVDKCVQFLTTIENEKVCMIMSGSLGQYIVSCVHNMAQVDSIFIFCRNKKQHEQWAKDWFKIKGVFTDIHSICEVLKNMVQRCEQNAISMSFMDTTGDLSNKKLDQLDPCFMYTQILKEILLTINFEKRDFNEFIEYCREHFIGNARELQNVNKLQQDYDGTEAIQWYTAQCFLYRMVNCSLRLMNVNIMIKMGFFIGDLHQHINQLYQQQYGNRNSSESFVVYRGQGISKTDFNQMNKSKGGLISFNNFLSTSKNPKTSLSFAKDATTDPNLVSVLFIMKINPFKSTTPFASIADISRFKKEDEILFSMHTVFRINNIELMNENQNSYQVDLTLTNDNDKDLRQLADRIREETEGSTGWDQLGVLLLKIGEPKKAEEVYHILLDQTTDNIKKAYFYYRIGWAKDDQGEYNEALRFYEKSLKIRQQLLPSNHPDLANSYNIIGVVYYNLGESEKALLSHEKALVIRKQTFPLNYLDLAKSYGNIGLVYSNMNRCSKAISYYEKALEIQQQLLPSYHPDLANSYGNIGLMYHAMNEYSKALLSYEKALVIRQKSLPPNHPDIAKSYIAYGLTYSAMGEYLKALSYYKKAFVIQQQSFPSNHPALAASYNNIGLVYENIGQYLKAREFYQHATEIAKQSLSPDHPHLKIYKENFDRVNHN